MDAAPPPPADPLAYVDTAVDSPEEPAAVATLLNGTAPPADATAPSEEIVNDDIPVIAPAPSVEPVAAPAHVEDVAMSLVSLGHTNNVDGQPSTTPTPELPPNDNIIDTNIDCVEYLTPKLPTKYTMKPRDPKRDTSIPFEEMQRLMRVYGPIKCLRNRTPKESGKDLKIDSIKRKFYRWFPDFDSRFERTSEGWYKPKFGHEEEMLYRAEMRKQDQDELVKKRNTKRTSKKTKENDVAPMVPPLDVMVA
jgi:hypothetical protein